jgi:hypothetical protein
MVTAGTPRPCTPASTSISITNSQGGVDGRKVKLVNKDDELKTDKMIALTNEFIADKNVLALAAIRTPGASPRSRSRTFPVRRGLP